MHPTVAHLYRHPVKSLGEEAVEALDLEAGCAAPWDRTWAIAHGGSDFDPANPAWVRARNFVNQTQVPELARIRVAFDAGTGTLTLSHPERPDLRVRPETAEGARALTDWLAPLADDRLAGPFTLARVPGQALTDFPDTHLLICSTATLRSLEGVVGKPLAHIRFRANVWLDGLDPWAELELAGREIALGGATLRLTERCERCNATAADPETGTRDAAIPTLLRKHLGHRDFGIYARVETGGRVAVGDPAVW